MIKTPSIVFELSIVILVQSKNKCIGDSSIQILFKAIKTLLEKNRQLVMYFSSRTIKVITCAMTVYLIKCT